MTDRWRVNEPSRYLEAVTLLASAELMCSTKPGKVFVSFSDFMIRVNWRQSLEEAANLTLNQDLFHSLVFRQHFKHCDSRGLSEHKVSLDLILTGPRNLTSPFIYKPNFSIIVPKPWIKVA